MHKPTVICKQVLGCLNLFVKDHVENQNARQLNVHITLEKGKHVYKGDFLKNR